MPTFLCTIATGILVCLLGKPVASWKSNKPRASLKKRKEVLNNTFYGDLIDNSGSFFIPSSTGTWHEPQNNFYSAHKLKKSVRKENGVARSQDLVYSSLRDKPWAHYKKNRPVLPPDLYFHDYLHHEEEPLLQPLSPESYDDYGVVTEGAQSSLFFHSELLVIIFSTASIVCLFVIVAYITYFNRKTKIRSLGIRMTAPSAEFFTRQVESRSDLESPPRPVVKPMRKMGQRGSSRVMRPEKNVWTPSKAFERNQEMAPLISQYRHASRPAKNDWLRFPPSGNTTTVEELLSRQPEPPQSSIGHLTMDNVLEIHARAQQHEPTASLSEVCIARQ